MENSTIQFTIAFTDPALDDEEREREVQNLRQGIKDLDIEKAGPVRDPNPPEGNKSMGGFLAGVFAIQVLGIHVREILDHLREQLSNKRIKLKVEGNGKMLEVEVSNPEEIDMVVRKAQAFLENPTSQPNKTTIDAMGERDEDLPSFSSTDKLMAYLDEDHQKP
uniref:Uncharacterized protein n=1 Tax=Candidatus Kentrum sp. FW TaxID=2126338 RepID=A0A450U222_9GAMM|nr:MAG: hypothetical protein BECKFW1821C_GA0114237_11105 [Candidatus Kentron sp. FW]